MHCHPDWISNVLPENKSYSNEDNCISEYINPSLEALHKSTLYTSALLPEQILQEYSVALYRGLFGMLYCLTSEEAVANKGTTMKFVAGGLHELIACVDVADMVAGLAQMVKAAGGSVKNAHVSFILDQKTTFDDLVSGKPISGVELFSRLMPPHARITNDLAHTFTTAVRQIGGFYFTECYSEDSDKILIDKCAYRYGGLVVMIVPIIYTAGQWAIVRSGPLLARLQVFRGIKKADVVAGLFKDGAQADIKAGKLIVRKGDEVTTVEKVGDDVVVSKGGITRDIDELAPNGKIPKNAEFNKWFDDLSEAELNNVWNNDKLRSQIEVEIRKPGGLHEWCMVCEVEQFKKWGVKMEDIKNFRTKTTELVGTNPYDGTPFAHSVINSEGKIVSGPSSKLFHNELQSLIGSSNSIVEFNTGLLKLLEKWKINPDLLPPFIK